ncbi:MAG: AAA family ATPase [Clostridiales Family XIII bacterium]|nr:AAA family ATPase [Clostridiales Family XIII bacterium]
MGHYLNPQNRKFEIAINSDIYVDKTGLIASTNSVVNTEQRYMCVSRPRRFGKSLAADMLATYYDSVYGSHELFVPFEIIHDDNFEVHFGKYDVIALNMQDFIDDYDDMDIVIEQIQSLLIGEIQTKYTELPVDEHTNLFRMMEDVYRIYNKQFVILIDEWDSVFRVHKNNRNAHERYLTFLRRWLKDRSYIALAYMTGILPIKKYGVYSTLNMFDEFSMTFQGPLAKYTGFTQSEVSELCSIYNMNLQDMERWYNGYKLVDREDTIAIYSPKSVVTALLMGRFSGYWNKTEDFDALKIYIDMDYNGLREAIVALLAGDRIHIDISSFHNDMVTFSSYEDILTLLVHLGYLGYDFDTEEVFIPNKEISKEFITAMKGAYGDIVKLVKASMDLLRSTWELDYDKKNKEHSVIIETLK